MCLIREIEPCTPCIRNLMLQARCQIGSPQPMTQPDLGEEGIFSQGLSSQLPGDKSASELARAKKQINQNAGGRR